MYYFTLLESSHIVDKFVLGNWQLVGDAELVDDVHNNIEVRLQ